MNVYDDIKKLYDESNIYNNEFAGYEDDFSFWNYWIKKIKPKRILEVGIGNGRLIKLLSSHVFQYDGLEISKNIIKDFIEKNPNYSGKIYNQDMKNINIDCIYDLILVPFNTFSYLYTLNDIRNFFNGIKKISDNNTIVVIDIFNPTLDDLNSSIKYKLCGTFNVNEEKYDLYEKHFYDSVNQIITYVKKYVSTNNEVVFDLPVRVFFPQEFLNLCELNGFYIEKLLGDYNNDEFSENSRKQILFLKKR